MDPKFSSDMMLLEDSDDAGWFWKKSCHFNKFFGSLRHKLLICIYIRIRIPHVFHTFLCFYGSLHFDAVVLLKFNHLTGASEKTAEASEDS